MRYNIYLFRKCEQLSERLHVSIIHNYGHTQKMFRLIARYTIILLCQTIIKEVSLLNI
jgi:hypothetical protein